LPLLIVGDRKLHDFDVPAEPGDGRTARPYACHPLRERLLGEEAAGVKEGGCQILHNLLKNFRACPNAAPTAMAGYF
jgi:hypothetical protein